MVWQALWNYVDRVHDALPQTTGESVLYDADRLWHTVAVPALYVAAFLYIVHFAIAVPLCGRLVVLVPSGTTTATAATTTTTTKDEKLARHRIAFAATNLIVNAILTCIGFTLEADPGRQRGNDDVRHRLLGLDYIACLPAWHVGVQLWAFPLGVFWIAEDAVMLAHHVALVWTAILPCCVRVGFRWHVPFFFGYVLVF